MKSFALGLIVVVVASLAVARAPEAGAAVPGPSAINIELHGASAAEDAPGLDVGAVAQAGNLRRFRRGNDFGYAFTNLPNGPGPYYLRLWIAERCPTTSVMDITWGAIEGVLTGTVVSGYDICAQGSASGAVRWAVIGPVALAVPGNQFFLEFHAVAGHSVVSTIEIGSTPTTPFLSLGAAGSRHFQGLLPRYQSAAYETVLGRLGGRYDLDLAAQRLAIRTSALGTWADDLSQLVVGVQAAGATPRILPLADRYPIFSHVGQSLTLTSVRYDATEPSLGLTLSATFRAPFYPQDEATSLPPVFLIDVQITSTTPATVILARPVIYDSGDVGACPGCPPQATASANGVRWGSIATFDDQNRVSDPSQGTRTDEALVALSATGPVFAQTSPTGDCTSFLPCFAPQPDPNRYVFQPRPRGWVGLQWPAGTGGTARFAMASIAEGASGDHSVFSTDRPGAVAHYAFHYRSLGLTAIEDVVARTAADAALWTARSAAFDAAVDRDSSFSLADPAATDAARNLMAYSLQSYLVNSWWGDNVGGTGPAQWYSVWEGTCCFFHSTLDVQYNDEQLMVSLWPDLLGKQLDEWPLFTKTDSLGQTYPMHDMGNNVTLAGQSYPYDMPVEESANYVLLLYAYWRTTNDTARLTALLPAARAFGRYLTTADTDGNGLPDRGTFNTIDQGSPAVLSSADQTYLGVKAASAAQALLEMGPAVGGLPDQERTDLSLLRHRVDQTLALTSWRGDHFAVTLDPSSSITQAERDAYGIYATNGLLWLLEGGGALPVSDDTLTKMGIDLHTATNATMGPAGSVHTSVANGNAWFSQNFWRDDIALYLGATWNGGSFLPLVARYWAQQVDFARRLDGAWWDVVIYNGPVVLGASAGAPGSGGGLKAADASGYGQSLGYYPRGTTIFGLLPAAAGVSINRPDGVLGLVGAARPDGVRVPLLALANWSTGTVPVGAWQNGAFTVSPPTGSPVIERAATSPGVDLPASFSPNRDGAGDVLQGTAHPVPDSRISQSVSNGLTVELTSLPGHDLSWDGTLGGVAVEQGAPTRVCAFADDPAPQNLRIGGCSNVFVNNTIPEPNQHWYLAEGSTQYGFQEFVLLQNPGDATATVTLTYQTTAGPVARAPLDIPPRSRRTVHVNDEITADLSTQVDANEPIVVERAMYLADADGSFREGDTVLGVTAPRTTWYLAEGSTRFGFDDYVLVQNPSTDTVTVTFTFSVEGGGQVTAQRSVPGQSRATLYANDVLTGDISTRVDATGPVIVERAMYWGGTDRRQGATAATAVSQPSRYWYLAEGSTCCGFDEYLLLQNPSASTATAQLVYDTADGPVPRAPLALPPRSRTTLHLNEELPNQDVAVRLLADQPVIVERSMFFGGPARGSPTSRSGGTSTHGSPSPSRVWHVAEGSTAHGFDEFVLIENPNPVAARVVLTSQPDQGVPAATVVSVAASSRLTVKANDLWPDQDLSLLVEADQPVVVERSMYFGGLDRRRGGTDTVVAR